MMFDKLKIGDFGDEVARLHAALQSHGFDLPVHEINRKFFGPATRKALRDYQKGHQLDATGALDPRTVTALGVTQPRNTTEAPHGAPSAAGVPPGSPAVLENHSEPTRKLDVASTKAQPFRIHGTVTDSNGYPAIGLTVRAFWQDATMERPLGSATTDDHGLVEIVAMETSIGRGPTVTDATDIIIRVLRGTALLHEVRVVRYADRDVAINLTVDPPAPSAPPRLSSRTQLRLKNLTRAIPDDRRKGKLERLFLQTEGDFQQVRTRLAEDEDFTKETIEQVTFAHDLGELFDDHDELVSTFVKDTRTNSLRDIARNYRPEHLKSLIRTKGVPNIVGAKDDEERLERFTSKVKDRLFRMEPAAVLHRMVRDDELTVDDQNVRHGLLAFFNRRPDIDFRKTSVLRVLQDPDSLKEVPEAHQGKVVTHLKSLQRLSAVSPKAEAVPVLMKAGLTSAYAINEVPMERFVSLFKERLGGEDAARAVHRSAQNATVHFEHEYVALREAVLGAPIHMIHGGLSTEARKELFAQITTLKNFPVTYEALFGSVNLCECEHCNSVYSPAAYLVELFQYLRNNNLDPENTKTGMKGIDGTPLQMFFRRRPDLGRLQLTCENTNTLIPYIDLVNEVMESFVVHLDEFATDTHAPKQATIAEHNVEDETSGELLAEPQHTNYKAYRILKNAVYPVCKLPYHQPIDATRRYLEHLGTSRYELFSTFRADVSIPVPAGASVEAKDRAHRMEELQVQASDRAIAAEFLHLTQEEYVILTKEAFLTAEWYTLKRQTPVTEAQYRDMIGLKPTWAYYGLSSEAHMLDELKRVKPKQESGLLGFLRRTNLLYTDLIGLLKTEYINPNYPSGKALAYMNSLRVSYRYLQSLVHDNQANLKQKYKTVVQFLQNALKDNPSDRFDQEYVRCWVYKYFSKIGKVIVLEDASACKCIEGTIRLWVIHAGDDAGSFIDLYLDVDCQIHILNSNPKRFVGHLDTNTGKLVLDQSFLAGLNISKLEFIGLHGETGNIHDWVLFIRFNNEVKPLICTDYTDTCDISKTQLKHLDGTDLVPTEYDRLHRFIRLWCKLGWSIPEVDQAIISAGHAQTALPVGPNVLVASHTLIALEPSPDTDDTDEPGPDFPDPVIAARPPSVNPDTDCKPEPISQVKQDITPYLIEQLVAVKKLRDRTGLELAYLLSYWTSIGTYGENSLYARLFLKPNALAIDDVFKEDAFGTYLTQAGKISDHLPILMSTLKSDVDMIRGIMSTAGIPNELTLDTVSQLYRHTLLAKTLGLRIHELPNVLALMAPLSHPFEQPSRTLAFYDLFAEIEESNFDHRELNYLLFDRDDPDRPFRPALTTLFQLAIGLRDALIQIDVDHPDIKDDREATEDWLRSKLSLLYDGTTVEHIISLLQGTTVYLDNTRGKFTAKLDEADQGEISTFLLDRQKDEEKEAGGFATFVQRVHFNGKTGLQLTGILSLSDRTKLIERLVPEIQDTEARDKFLIAVNKMLTQPQTFFEDVLRPIFEEAPDAARAVLLAEDRVDTVHPAESSDVVKRAFFAKAFAPYLREELRQRLTVQTLAGAVGLDQALTEALVIDVLRTEAGNSVYQEIIHLKEQKDLEAPPQSWNGFFVPEKDGRYTFILEAEGESTLTFNERFNWSSKHTDDEHINFYRTNSFTLKAGRAYPFVIKGHDEDDKGNIIGLFSKFNDQQQTLISNKSLFPALRIGAFQHAYVRLQKAAILLKGFDTTLEELQFFLEFPASFDGLDFNSLTFPQWLRLAAFYRFSKSFPQKELSLLDFLRWTNRDALGKGEPTLASQISALTGWERADVIALILPKHFNLSHRQHFKNEINLRKLQLSLSVAKKIGVGIHLLFRWGRPMSVFKPTREIADDIRATIRARYSQEEWEQAIKPMHDQLRENQKQALIAYLLAQPVLLDWGVRDADGLFEFFLIDVQMDACMETSRIKQAISSVQLFVQRCFLGLEATHGVGSEVLDRQRWEWMSRYRVWEANRKVFLYPENWIRPELRDVKSPFFEELQSDLLQNDVSDETVRSAFKKYLIQVNDVANLEVVGHYLEGEPGPGITKGKMHVVARTCNAPHFFYYRYYDYESSNWYPWEKMEVDIPSIDIENEQGEVTNNGAFVIPIVWNGRLFVFFPQFLRKNWTSTLAKQRSASDSGTNSTLEDSEPIPYWEIKMGWSEYKNRRWTPKSISNHAINSMDFWATQDWTWGISFVDLDKFVFASFSDKDRIKIQIYYTDRRLMFFERATRSDGDTIKAYFFNKTFLPHGTVTHLPKAFRFNGDSISTDQPAFSFNPEELREDPPRFHYQLITGGNKIFPLQAKGTDNNPADLRTPAFTKTPDSSSVTVNQGVTYNFSYPLTSKLLEVMAKNELERVFDSVPLSNDNYGANGTNQYHELKRPYAIYSWETLFHSVALLAEHLSKSQRFEEAMKWWHFIFDPVAVQGNIKYVWNFLPFQVADSENVLARIFDRLDPNASDVDIKDWRDNPFQPHLSARGRPTAYMKTVVMKYIDNLIAWGDYLFRQDTIETLNQATQLYVLAGHILGPRPEFIPKRGKIQPKSYMDLVDKWDAFSNAIVDLELVFPFSHQIAVEEIVENGKAHYVNVYGFATSLYFCIPDNPKLLEYWDTVADRLFKIRHCLNIEGVFRKLALFEPPIDPGLLVQAAAQGLSISTVLNDLSTPMPNYRFNYLLQRALEVTSEVKALGNALLSALEKKDGESLSLLRAKHDTNIQNLMMEIRKKQLEEAEKTKASLEENRKAPEARLKYYQHLAGEDQSVPEPDAEYTLILDGKSLPEVKDDSGMMLIGEEAEEIKKAKVSADLQIAVGAVETLASILSLVPDNSYDVKPFGIGVGLKFGGSDLNNFTSAVARGMQIGVNYTSFQSSAAGRKASHLRQLHERMLQADNAGQEIMQIDKQVTAQEIRIALAQKEIENHQVQIDQTKEAEEFLKTKFSNDQLYHWMGEQLKDLYYQTYSFAYDLAKKAEKVFRFEMGLSTSDIIKFGYWDSAKNGLLAGEQLYLDLKRLENSYIEAKPHDYEIVKHISLKQLDPLALIQLKETGLCEFDLREELFDLDYAGQYKRRIKTVSLSVPCVVGPYTNLNCIVRLLKHEYRNSKIATSASDYAKKLEEADERFVHNPIPTTAIAVSQGQNDSGVFELNFRDERYLPFEGAGVISSWRVELPEKFRQFDYQTISDVIVHVRYTSCEGGETLKQAALDHLTEYVENAADLSQREGLFHMLSLKHEFPNEWHRFLHPEGGATSQQLVLGRLKDRLPFFAKHQLVTNLTLHSMRLFARIEQELSATLLRSMELENLDPEQAESFDLSPGASVSANLRQYASDDQLEEEGIDGFWALHVTAPVPLTAEMLKDAWLVIKYQFELPLPES